MNFDWGSILVEVVIGLILVGMNYQVLKDHNRRIVNLEENKTNKEIYDKDIYRIDKDIQRLDKEIERLDKELDLIHQKIDK